MIPTCPGAPAKACRPPGPAKDWPRPSPIRCRNRPARRDNSPPQLGRWSLRHFPLRRCLQKPLFRRPLLPGLRPSGSLAGVFPTSPATRSATSFCRQQPSPPWARCCSSPISAMDASLLRLRPAQPRPPPNQFKRRHFRRNVPFRRRPRPIPIPLRRQHPRRSPNPLGSTPRRGRTLP